jgi:hypothetical protein
MNNIIRIKSIDVSLMAVKYVELYPKPKDCKSWKHFGIEKICFDIEDAFPTTYREEEYRPLFKIIDKEKFLWAMMICGVEFEFVKGLDFTSVKP